MSIDQSFINEKDITITACNKVKIDRTLISDEFLKEIGYQRKNWDLMVYEMKKFYIEHYV